MRRNVDVAFSVSGPPRQVECDPVLVDEMVINLLDNAAKYALRPDGRLEVSIAFMPHAVSLRFADDGPGIPPRDARTDF